MNLIWNKNIELLKKRFPQLSEILLSQKFDNEFPCKNEILFKKSTLKIQTAKNGMVTASEEINNVSTKVHSFYNPQKEAQNSISQPEIWEKSTTVFLGFGLGYHIIEWSKFAKENSFLKKKLVIVEPNIEYFFVAISVLDWSQVFEIENLVLAINCPPDSLIQLLENSQKVNIDNSGVSHCYFFINPNFTKHNDEYFKIVSTLIERNITKNKINFATLQKFGKLWCKNSLRNLIKMNDLSSVDEFNTKFSQKINNFPFLIIGAGPSLEEIAPFFDELNKRFVIICVETALFFLLKHKIQPDFIILTDPQYWAYRHIAGFSSPKSIFITEISTFPSVFRFNCKKMILCKSQFPIGQFIEKRMNLSLGDLGTGGSVASAAWNFLQLLGVKNIYLAGLDFGFPKKQTHIKGSSAENSHHQISNRIKTVDFFNIFTIFSANNQKSRDYEENEILTDSRMKMFSWWFESRIANCQETKNFTLCPRGLKTPGIQIAKIEEVLHLKNIYKEKNNILEEVTKLEPIIKKNKKNEFNQMINDFPYDEFLAEFPNIKPFV